MEVEKVNIAKDSKSPRNGKQTEKKQSQRKLSNSITPRSTNEESPITSTRDLVALKVDGDEEVRGGLEKYLNVPELRQQRMELLKKVASLDAHVENMLRMKGIYQKFCTAMHNFSTAIFRLDRNNQGVPYVANVKTLIIKMYEEFNSDEVKADIAKMCEQNVPFIEDLTAQFENFCQLCESIIITHIHYHVTFLEDFHLVTGKIRGMMKTIITLIYDDNESDSNNDVIVNEKEIEEASAKSDEDLNNNNQEFDDNKSQETPGPESPSNGAVPTIILQHQSSNENGTAKELHQLRMVFSNINDQLSKIQRLSLGNPRVQSMRDTFVSIGEVLTDASPLFQLYQDDVPCVDKICAVISRMKKVTGVKRPSEKHVEQLKLLLGECDGRVLIVAKYLSLQNQME